MWLITNRLANNPLFQVSHRGFIASVCSTAQRSIKSSGPAPQLGTTEKRSSATAALHTRTALPPRRLGFPKAAPQHASPYLFLIYQQRISGRTIQAAQDSQEIGVCPSPIRSAVYRVVWPGSARLCHNAFVAPKAANVIPILRPSPPHFSPQMSLNTHDRACQNGDNLTQRVIPTDYGFLFALPSPSAQPTTTGRNSFRIARRKAGHRGP